MLRVYAPAPQYGESIREKVRGSIIINFGRSCVYQMHSDWHADMPATTIYIDDVRNEVDPEMHPVTGLRDFSRVYRGWYHRAPTYHGGRGVDGDVAIKWARGPARIRELERERENYLRMAHMQGEIIPVMHDYLRTEIMGVEVACLVLQWCGGMFPRDRKLFMYVLIPLGAGWCVC